MSTKSVSELTPPPSGAPAPLMINGVAVPTGPRAERYPGEDPFVTPFVTPPRGIEMDVPSAAREADSIATSGPEAITSPAATGFTPRPDRLAEPLSADNAQAILPPQACVFVAKYVPWAFC